MVCEPKQERYSSIEINFPSIVQLTVGEALTTPMNPTVYRLLVELERLLAAGYGQR